MRVSNMKSTRSYASVANQYEINDRGFDYFQSYQTLIAKKKGYNYVISVDYNYSRTTSRYFTEWLRNWGWRDSEIDEFKKWARKQIANNAKNGVTTAIGRCNVKLVQEL